MTFILLNIFLFRVYVHKHSCSIAFYVTEETTSEGLQADLDKSVVMIANVNSGFRWQIKFDGAINFKIWHLNSYSKLYVGSCLIIYKVKDTCYGLGKNSQNQHHWKIVVNEKNYSPDCTVGEALSIWSNGMGLKIRK